MSYEDILLLISFVAIYRFVSDYVDKFIEEIKAEMKEDDKNG